MHGTMLLVWKKNQERTVVLLTNIDLTLVFWFCAEKKEIKLYPPPPPQ